MANSNFVVHNGLTVGPLTIDAATGSITTTGSVSTTGTTPTAFSANIVAGSGTASSSTTTGALVVVGGAGISGDAYIGGNLRVTGTTTFISTEYIGGAEVVVGNVVANSGATSSSTSTGALVVIGGAGISGAVFTGSNATHAGNVNLTATNSALTTNQTTGYVFNESATTVNAFGAATTLNIGNASGITSILGVTTHGGNLVAASTTASTSSSTGALVVRGGTGVSGDLYIGGQAVVNGNVTIGGNLSVTGQSVSIGASTLSVNDPVINLNTPSDLTPLTVTTTSDIGLKFHYYSGSDRHAFVGRAVDTGYLEWYADGNDTANVFTGTVYGTVKSGAIILANTTAATGANTGVLQVWGGGSITGAMYAGTSYDNGNRVITSVTITAGTDLSGGGTITGPTGSVTLNDTSTLATVTGRGATTSTAVTFNGQVNMGASIVPTANVTYNVGSSTAWFNTFYGQAIHAQYADLAENYQGDKAYAPGTVVMFGGAQEVTIATPDTTAVAGVVSTNPATLMNGGLSGATVVAVALTGRVPCNVIGPVAKGDLMVSAGFGFAKTNNNAGVGQVIGKALSDFTGAKGQIEVVVGRF